MKNKYKISLLAIIMIAVACFAVTASGVKIPYLQNYGTNFRRNVKNIAETIGLNLPEGVQNYLNKTPKPLTTEEKLDLIEKMEADNQNEQASPTPSIQVEEQPLMSAKSKIVALKNAYSAAYISYNSHLICAADTALICYDANGNELWSTDISLSDPILKTSGRYIIAAEKGGTKAYLFSGKKKIWEYATESPIMSADVSENGDGVIITDKPHYKGEVNVINRKGELVYQWNSGKYEVLDADISAASRKLAVSLLNTENGADTKISFFDLKQSESYASADLTDTIAFDIEFCGETLNAVCDNKTVGINTKGHISWQKDFENKNLTKYFVENSGYKLLVFDNSNVSQMSVISGRGGEKSNIETQTFPDCIYVFEGHLLYNNGRRLIYTSLSGRNQQEYNCTRDVYNLLILDSSNLLVVYNSSIEFINL